jgi:hypothetical protein
MAVINYSPKQGVLGTRQQPSMTLAELAAKLSGQENALSTRAIGGVLGLVSQAREYDYPDTALGWASLPAKAVTGIAKGMMDVPGKMIDDAYNQVAGLSDGRAVTEGALGLLGTSAVLPFGMPAGSLGSLVMRASDDELTRAARVSGIDEDAFANLVKQGHMTPQVAPIGAMGKELGFSTGYSKGLKPSIQTLQELDAGLKTKKPKGVKAQRGLIADIENMEGKILVPMPGDRTSRDIVTEFRGEKIDPYQVHGGYDYMPDVGGWASGKGVISRYDKMFKGLEGRGVGVATPMSGAGSDYAHAAIDMMYRSTDVDAIPSGTKSTIKKEVNQWLTSEYDKAQKAYEKNRTKAESKGKEFSVKPPAKPAPFKGLTDEGKSQLYNDGLYRKAFMESLDKDRVARLPGAPSATALRHSITDDRFRYLTRGDPDPLSGQRFMAFTGESSPMPVSSLNSYQHPTYNTHLAGQDLGGLAVPAPRTILFPDFAKEMERQGRPMSQHNYMFDRMKPKQELRPDVIEGILKFEDKIRRGQ